MMIRLLTAVLVVATSVPTFAQDATTPLDAFPKSMGAVVHLKAPSQTLSKLSKFVGKINPQAAFAIGFAGQGMIGGMVRNPSLAGVDRTAGFWVGMKLNGQEPPSMCFAVKATDLEAMKEGLFADFTFVEKDGWVMYTEDAGVAKSLEATGANSMASAMGADAKQVFMDADAAVYVNLPVVRAEYRSEIDEAKEQIESGLDQLPALADPQAGVDMEAVAELYGGMINGLMQGLEDAEGLAITATINDNDVLFEDFFVVKEGSRTAGFFAAHPTGAIKTLANLPSNQLAYLGVHVDMPKLTNSLSGVMGKLLGDEKMAKQFEMMLKEYPKTKPGEYAASFQLGSAKDGAFQSVAIGQVGDAAYAKEFARKYSKVSAAAGSAGGQIKMEVDLSEDAETIGGVSTDVLKVTQDLDAVPDPIGIQKPLMETLYGGNTITTRIAYLDNATVQTTGGGKGLMESALKASKNTELGGPLATARQSLSEKANFVMLIDLPRMAREVTRLVAESDQPFLPLNPNDVKSITLPNSFTGVSVGMEKNTVRVRCSIPVEQIKGIISLVEFFQQMQNPPAI